MSKWDSIKAVARVGFWDILFLVLALVNFVTFLFLEDGDPDKTFALINFWGFIIAGTVNRISDMLTDARARYADRDVNIYVTRDEFEKIIRREEDYGREN